MGYSNYWTNRRTVKVIQAGKKGIRMALFIDGMVVNVENSKDSTTITKYLEILSDYSKITQYIVNIQKSIAFSYLQ